jgi:hypothetical protein
VAISIKTALRIPALAMMTMLMASGMSMGQSFSLLAVTGGITGTLNGSDYVNTFGTMNALGIGTPETGLTLAVLSNGALYFSEFQVQFTGLATGHNASFTAYVSPNFTHSGAQVVEMCTSTGACTSSSGYAAVSLSSASPSTIIASMGNTTATVGIGVFLPDNDGAAAFTGADGAAVVNLVMTDTTSGHKATATWTFNGTPSQTVQDAVQLKLSTAPGGLTISSGTSSDFSLAFGNVNGLGVGATNTVSASGGTVYYTPYLLTPAFTDFTSTTATIKVYASTTFAHPTILQLKDAAASGGPYTVISTTVGSQTQITSTAGDRTSITRYLGLFVGYDNAASPFLGADSATLTYTMTVP